MMSAELEGDGTIESPYLIYTEEQLKNIATYGLTKCYKLMNDITIADDGNSNWKPRGGGKFSGIFDGDFHVIRNMKINSTDSHVGLFKQIDYGEVRNLGIEDSVIYTTGQFAGAIAGIVIHGVISRCYIIADVTAYSYVGGFTGESDYSTISEVFSSGYILSKTSQRAGGIAGQVTSGTIQNSYSLCDVKAQNFAGGIAGGISTSAAISNCYTAGKIYNNISKLGGFVGVGGATTSMPSIRNCVAASPLISSGVGTSTYKIVGDYFTPGATVSNNYAYDRMQIEIQGRITYITSSNLSSLNGRGVSLSQLRTKLLYSGLGWNFNTVWDISEGNSFPYLRNLPNEIQISLQESLKANY